ncbi:MAG TPA: acyl-CoA dehydrogenase family protein [Acidimicrobiales bacterium]|jgi:alkylation response protein AidB-like acyl-CoA dehydrogenase|nr:acyl-CoA dehydrogenase family protein [Acidimicrobiales bacterium]
MNFDDSADDAEFRREVSVWLADHAQLRTGLDDWSRNHEHPDYVKRCREWQYSLYEGGWGAITWPAEYGGRGESSWHQTIFNQEAVKYDVSAGAFAVGIGMCGPTLIAHGNEEQKQQHLGAMLRGEEVWCQLFSEPDAGSDLAGLKTRALRDGDEFVVNGQKVWTSGAQHSDWAILIARTRPDVPKHQGITYFLVDMRTPGIEVRPLRQITGFAHFNEVFLTDVAVPVENVVGAIDNGWAVTHTTLSNERTLIGGGGQGITTEQVLDLARRLGGSRDPLVRQHVAAFYTRTQLLRFMNYRVQTALSHGRQPGPEAATTKLLVSQHMSLTGDLLMELVGTNGMLADGSAVDNGAWETAFLNQWMSKLGGGTDNIQRNSLGERVLGLPREPRTDKDVPFSALA